MKNNLRRVLENSVALMLALAAALMLCSAILRYLPATPVLKHFVGASNQSLVHTGAAYCVMAMTLLALPLMGSRDQADPLLVNRRMLVCLALAVVLLAWLLPGTALLDLPRLLITQLDQFSLLIIPALVLAGVLLRRGEPAGLGMALAAMLILFGSSSNLQMGKLFSAALTPWLLLLIALAVIGHADKQRNNSGVSTRTKLRYAAMSALLIVLVYGTCFVGMFMPAEAITLAALCAGLYWRVQNPCLNWPQLKEAFHQAAIQSAAWLATAALALLLSYLLLRSGYVEKLNVFAGISPVMFLLLLNIALSVAVWWLGSIMPLLIAAALLLPHAEALHIDPSHFGILLIFNILCVCMAKRIQVNPLHDHTLVLRLALLAGLQLLITFAPSVSMWLPRIIN
jgi:TRAP-type C4-dicarboxylate transport system permease large subunit